MRHVERLQEVEALQVDRLDPLQASEAGEGKLLEVHVVLPVPQVVLQVDNLEGPPEDGVPVRPDLQETQGRDLLQGGEVRAGLEVETHQVCRARLAGH